jgi:hypothetical protein
MPAFRAPLPGWRKGRKAGVSVGFEGNGDSGFLFINVKLIYNKLIFILLNKITTKASCEVCF